MSKLDEAFDLIKTNPLNGYEDREAAKQAIKDLFKELIGEERWDDYGDWLIDAEALLKEIDEL